MNRDASNKGGKSLCYSKNMPSVTSEEPLSSPKMDSFEVDGTLDFDPANDLPKYQKSKAFPPDQLEIWDKHRPKHINDNLIIESEKVRLYEITCMKQALIEVQNRGALPSLACQSIKAWFGAHYEWVNTRYHLTRDLFIPRMEKRFHFPKDVIQANESCHEILQQIASMVNKIKKDDSIDDLQRMWSLYETAALRWTALQQAKTVILYHAFFSPKEVSNIHKRFVLKNSSSRLGGYIHYIGVDRFRSEILPRENYPSMSWSLNFKKHYDAYVEYSVAHLDVLISGNFMNRSLNGTSRKRCHEFKKDDRACVNPFDPIYQVSKDFPPNKLEEWEEDFEDHIKVSPRYIVNNAHLAEVAEMKTVLIEIHRSGVLKDWETLSIQKWFEAHQNWVVDVYNLYNTSIIKWFSTRFHYPSVLLEGQKEYVQVLEDISKLVQSLKPGDSVYTFMTKWSEYHHKMHCFFELFNRIHFTLVHAYFSRKELSDHHIELAEKGIPGLGPTIYHMGKDKFRNMMMKRENIGDIYWHLDFGRQYIDYCENVAVHMKALQSRIAPSEKCKAPSLLSALDDLWDDPSSLDKFLNDGLADNNKASSLLSALNDLPGGKSRWDEFLGDKEVDC